ncbi:hypothetical protein FisN_6Hu177 [Fistulifera solaris]|uniref:Uncharacterized protein n=1 Tax=Fistulifera solaris TaxID=1519565 RepID=A0A1Z5JNQ3_FISSO|nr:hypothetical protein FisN_6Hu177 [Fistulifera solaris]|eukprot:GAX15526.1 hypothetical protein FisN_6Hu177 [Fistulifera solaris]
MVHNVPILMVHNVPILIRPGHVRLPIDVNRRRSHQRSNALSDFTMVLSIVIPNQGKTHRRSHATDWSSVLKRLYHGKNVREHRRSNAMTGDEYMEITWVCEELHGPSQSPCGQGIGVWNPTAWEKCDAFDNEL